MSSAYSSSNVKKAFYHFVFGKGASILLSVTFIVLTVRTLPTADFGAYSAMLGMLGLMSVVSSLGFESVIERYVPELRVGGDKREKRLIQMALTLRLISCSVLAILFVLLTETFSLGVKFIPWLQSVYIVAFISVLFGLNNLVSSVLDSRLQQRYSQSIFLILISIKIILFLGVSIAVKSIGYSDLVLIELVAYSIAVCVGLYLLARSLSIPIYFGSSPGLPKHQFSSAALLKRRMTKFALYNYGAQVLHQLQGANALRVLAGLVGGTMGAAALGVVLHVTELIQRYLPTTLFVRLIRPIFVSRYLETGDFQVLNTFARMLVKINFIIIAPLVSSAFFFGDEVLGLIFGERYYGLGIVLTLAFVLVAVQSHTAVISLLANTLEVNRLQVEGGVFSVIGVLVGLAVAFHYGEYGLFIGAIVFSFIYNIYAIKRLNSLKFMYQPCFLTVVKIVLISIICYFPLALFESEKLTMLTGVLIWIAAGIFYSYIVMKYVGFDDQEVHYMSKLVPKRILSLISFGR